MDASQSNEIERIRQMADSLDCIVEQDFYLLADVTPNTGEAWRKRGLGPAYLRLGNRVFYPRAAIALYFASITKQRTPAPAKELL